MNNNEVIDTSAVNWIAYRLIKYNNCESDEIIGYYQTMDKAMAYKIAWIEKERQIGRTFNGVCCNSLDKLKIEEIIIKS